MEAWSTDGGNGSDWEKRLEWGEMSEWILCNVNILNIFLAFVLIRFPCVGDFQDCHVWGKLCITELHGAPFMSASSFRLQ